MKANKFSTEHTVKAVCILLVTLIAFGFTNIVFGQAETRWLHMGNMQHKLSATCTEPELMRQSGLIYPGIQDPYNTHYNRKALWIGVESHTDENGDTWTPRVVHSGPRIFNFTDFSPQPMQLISRLPAPEVTVDGLLTFARPVHVDKVDPELKADRMVVRSKYSVRCDNI